MRPSVKGCKTDLVQNHLGDSYDVVKTVYENLDAIQSIAEFLKQELNHTLLIGREEPDQHPISSITGLVEQLAAKQALLQSGLNIKTINNVSLLGSENITLTHETLTEKDSPDQHPISSITGLTEELIRIANYNQTIGIDVVTVVGSSLSVNSSNNAKHYAFTSNNLNTVVLNEAISVAETGKGVVVFFTQLGDGTVLLTGAGGIEVVVPENSVASTYDKGSTIAALAITSTKWIVMGNMSY